MSAISTALRARARDYGRDPSDTSSRSARLTKCRNDRPVSAMTGEIERVYVRLAELEREIVNLRGGYAIVNQRYTDALASLKELTVHSKEAATRAAKSAERSAISSKFAAQAAAEAAERKLVEVANAAADAAAQAAEAASQAAAAAAANQAEEVSLQASAEAAAATKIAAEAAAEAIHSARQAYDASLAARTARA